MKERKTASLLCLAATHARCVRHHEPDRRTAPPPRDGVGVVDSIFGRQVMQLSLATRTVFMLISLLSGLFSFLYATRPAKVATIQLGDASTPISEVSAMWGRHVAALLGAYALMLACASYSGSADRSIVLFAVVYEAAAVVNNESSGASATTCVAHRLRFTATAAVSAYDLWTAHRRQRRPHSS